MNIWPFSALSAQEERIDELETANKWLTQQRVELLARNPESERNDALVAQNNVLGDKAKMHDKMCEDLRRLRVTLRDMHPTDLMHAEETPWVSLIDLAIWILRGKPGPKGFEDVGKEVEGTPK